MSICHYFICHYYSSVLRYCIYVLVSLFKQILLLSKSDISQSVRGKKSVSSDDGNGGSSSGGLSSGVWGAGGAFRFYFATQKKRLTLASERVPSCCQALVDRVTSNGRIGIDGIATVKTC